MPFPLWSEGYRMRRFARCLTLAVALCGPMVAPAVADDADDARAVISAQLNAFKASDGNAAYAYAAPNIKAIFPTAESFMHMVEGGYAPVFRAGNAVFGPLTTESTGLRQEVYLTDAKGQSYIASYTLARQPDGSLKITGCSIRKGDDLSA